MTKPDDLPGYPYGKGRRVQVQLSIEEARRVRAFRVEEGHATDSAAVAALTRIGLAARGR